jgi:hypothetical protein
MGLLSKQEAETVEVNGKALRCVICSNNLFWTRSALLNTGAMTFFNLDWADKSATCFVCSECTYVHWFLGK